MKSLISALFVAGFLVAGQAVAQDDVQNRTLRLSTANSPSHPLSLGAQRFAELVSEKSGNRINVRVFFSGQLGPDIQNVSAMQGGTLDLIVGTTNMLAGNLPEFSALDFPFLFRDFEEVDAILDGDIGQELLEMLPSRQLVGLAYFDFGFRQFHNSKRPIETISDLSGLKLRVQPTPIYTSIVNAWGANAVPMAFPETYTAIEQRAIDGMSNPIVNVLDGKYFEVTEYLSLTNHIYQPGWIGIGQRSWDRLSATEQSILREAASEAAAYQRAESRRIAQEALGELETLGVSINTVSPEVLVAMGDMARGVTEQFTQEIGADFVARLHGELESLRAANAAE